MHPTLFRFGHLSLPTFGALAACGLMLALWLSERTARLARVDPGRLWDAGMFAVLAAFVLSRVQLVAMNWTTFRAYPLVLLAVPSLTATGVLLTGVATGAWLWFRRLPVLRALDAWAPCGMLVWCFLALGHLAEGSDPGLPTGRAWGVQPGGLRLQPVAFYAAFCAALLGCVAYGLLRARPAAGAVSGMTLLGTGAAQFLLSFLRQPGAAGPLGLDLLELAAVGMLLAGFALVLTAVIRVEPVS